MSIQSPLTHSPKTYPISHFRTAFSLWILTIVLFKMVIRMAAQALTLTGLMLLCASLIWAFNRNYTELQIIFEDGILTTSFGIHWYLSLVMGKWTGNCDG